MQYLNKKLINYFINNPLISNIYVYKLKDAIYFIKEIKHWHEILFEKRSSNGNYLCIARLQINSNNPKGYNFIRQSSNEYNIRHVFNLILLNRIYKYD